MTHSVSDNILELALDQLQAGEPLNQVLARYPADTDSLEPLLETAWALKVIDPVEVPGLQAMTDDRNEFLASLAKVQLQPVSSGPLARLKGWILLHSPWLLPDSGEPQREVRQMSFLFLKAALVFTLLFGSFGGLMVAAEESLPDSPIYSLKLAREQIRLAMNSDPAEEASLHLNLAPVRVREMILTAAQGDVPQEATISRLQTHMSEAFRYSAQTSGETMQGLLLQTVEMTRLQEQALIQAQEQTGQQEGQQPGQQARTRLREAAHQMSQWRQEAEDGLQDPLQFRLRHGHNRPEELPGPGQPGGNPDCSGDCDQNGDGNQYGQEPQDPPGGPGPGQPGGNPNCSGDCDQNGDGNQYGQDPQDLPGGPGPGQPGGNPDCTGDCQPDGDQDGDGNQYGQDPEDPPAGPGPGEPGGNPDCTGDCQPVGDQDGDGNQNGQDPEDPPPSPGPSEPGGNPESPGGNDPGGSGSPGGQTGGGQSGG